MGISLFDSLLTLLRLFFAQPCLIVHCEKQLVALLLVCFSFVELFEFFVMPDGFRSLSCRLYVLVLHLA